MLSVKQLKEIIKDLDDNMLVVLEGSDHNYRYNIYPHKDTAIYNFRDRTLNEDFDPNETSAEYLDNFRNHGEPCRRINILLIA